MIRQHFYLLRRAKDMISLIRKKTISTPLRIENPVRRPIVPPISPSWASRVTLEYSKSTFSRKYQNHQDLTFTSLPISSKVAVSKKMWTTCSWGKWTVASENVKCVYDISYTIYYYIWYIKSTLKWLTLTLVVDVKDDTSREVSSVGVIFLW